MFPAKYEDHKHARLVIAKPIQRRLMDVGGAELNAVETDQWIVRVTVDSTIEVPMVFCITPHTGIFVS